MFTDKQVGGQIGAGDNNRDDLMPYINSNTIIHKSLFQSTSKISELPVLPIFLFLGVRWVYLATICSSCSTYNLYPVSSTPQQNVGTSMRCY